MQLTISNVSKTYANGLKALTDVNLTIAPGMFGLLGPNGAGKSTLMRTISTLQDPDTGTIMLGDIDVIKQKEELRKEMLVIFLSFYSQINKSLIFHYCWN